MVKVTHLKWLVPGILNPDTPDRQGAVVPTQLQDLGETSQSQSQKNKVRK